MGKDPRPRHERRADPARWYKIDGAIGQGPDLVGLPDGVCVFGAIDDIIVVTYPAGLDPRETFELMKGAREVVQQAGIEKNVVVVPDAVKFLKLRPLSKDETSKIEKAHKAAMMKKASSGSKAVH